LLVTLCSALLVTLGGALLITLSSSLLAVRFPFFNLDSPAAAYLTRWGLHDDLEHSVSERRLGGFSDRAFRQWYHSVEAAVHTLGPVKAIMFFFMILSAFASNRDRILCDIHDHVAFVHAGQVGSTRWPAERLRCSVPMSRHGRKTPASRR
jgi:hypothetical protein